MQTHAPETLATCKACRATLVMQRFKWGLDWATRAPAPAGNGITCPKLPGYLGYLPHIPGPYTPPKVPHD
jgi:hypothetical protein